MNGTRGIITPHLDALAEGGITLKNYYVQVQRGRVPSASFVLQGTMCGKQP